MSDYLGVHKNVSIQVLYHHERSIPQHAAISKEKACNQANFSQKASVCVCVCVLCLMVNTHPLVTVLSVSPWNCLCCVGCCHCWRTSWTSTSSAFSATQVWTAASWAGPSWSSLCSGPILIHPCCHHKSTHVWLRLCCFHRRSHCSYSTWACLPRHQEGRFCPFRRCCSTGTQTEAELDRDKKKSKIKPTCNMILSKYFHLFLTW